MSSDFIKRKFLVVILASVVVGLAAFVGACALFSRGLAVKNLAMTFMTTPSHWLPPHWSPDGTTIVLHWSRGSYLVDVSDGTILRPVTPRSV